MSNFQWVTPPEQVFMQLFDDYALRCKQAVRMLLLSYAPRIEAWMKAEALWTDRTGNARQSLYADLQTLADAFELVMDYGVFYGKYLELNNAGRFAIVAPAVDHWFPIIWKDIEALFTP